MTSRALPRMAGGGRRFKVLLLTALVVSLVILLLFGAPLASPFSITKVTLQPNTFTPLTANSGFESNDGSWLINATGRSSASIVSGVSSSGNRSLYLHDVGGGVSVIYNDTGGQVLPTAINNYTSFGFDLRLPSGTFTSANSSVGATLYLSLSHKYLIPVTIIISNFSLFQNATVDNVNQTSITMLRGARSYDSWTKYELQLGTSRVASLVISYLKMEYNLTISSIYLPLFVEGFVLYALNADAYFDNVGLYNVAEAMATVTLSKSTILPASTLGMTVTLNGTQISALDSYGLLSDSLIFPLTIPLAYGLTIRIFVQTGWGTLSASDVSLNDPSLPTWL